MRIYTITLNPAYDIHAETATFVPFREHAAKILSRDVGGKGLNISKALQNNGVGNEAIVVLGKENAAEFRKGAEAEGLSCIWIEQEGRIRENLTVHSDNGKETRISFSGFSADETLLEKVNSCIEIDENTVITFTGSVPNGIPMSATKAILRKWKAQGAKIVIDSKSFDIEDILEVSPWLIKPNQEEISAYMHTEIGNFEDCADVAKRLCVQGVENVMISLGEQGALLSCAEGIYAAVPPNVQAVSTIGAGDSSIAGFIAAFAQGKDKAACLQTAVAYGTAACLQTGTTSPKKADIEEISTNVKTMKLE